MLKKILVPSLVLAISALTSAGCRDDSGNATPFPDAGGPDGSTNDADANETDAVIDAPATEGGDATNG